jgi:hypothetical protein
MIIKESCTCSVCEGTFSKKDVKQVNIKGKIKDVCKECLTAIHGLM